MQADTSSMTESEDAALNLPDDLSVVAEQLTDDANHLAERYPASSACKLIAPSSRLVVMKQIAAALVLIAIGGVSTALAIKLSSPRQDETAESADVNIPTKAIAETATLIQPAPSSTLDQRTFETRAAGFEPARRAAPT